MDRENSPLFQLLKAGTDILRAGKQTLAASQAGMCVVCTENQSVPEAKFCQRCIDEGRGMVVRAAKKANHALFQSLAKIVEDQIGEDEP